MMTDEEFDALWTSCGWREEIDRLRALLVRQYRADAALYAMPHDCNADAHEAALAEHDAAHAALAAELVPNVKVTGTP